jgi:hypothetical protein
MARTQTVSTTRTYLRMDLLKIQVKIALERAVRPGDLSRTGLASLLKGLEREWIQQVHVYGFDADGYVRCELVLRVDWQRHKVHIDAGKTSVEIDNRWSGDTSLELHNYLELFNDFVRGNHFRTQWRVAYRAGLDGNTVNRALGFVNATPVRWATGRDGITNVIPELDELTIGFWRVT